MRIDEDHRRAIRVRCLFFAAYRDLAGADQLEIELPREVTVSDLVRHVRERLGSEALPSRPVVAVNQEYASLDAIVREGDEVAFIPPVAGG
jgi:molybdopterin synthase catalytic subunit